MKTNAHKTNAHNTNGKKHLLTTSSITHLNKDVVEQVRCKGFGCAGTCL